MTVANPRYDAATVEAEARLRRIPNKFNLVFAIHANSGPPANRHRTAIEPPSNRHSAALAPPDHRSATAQGPPPGRPASANPDPPTDPRAHIPKALARCSVTLSPAGPMRR